MVIRSEVVTTATGVGWLVEVGRVARSPLQPAFARLRGPVSGEPVLANAGSKSVPAG